MSIEDPFDLINKWLSAREYIVVGKNIVRSDSIDKALGRARFVEDYFEHGRMLFVKQVLSTEPHALIEDIDYSRALEVPGVERVITYRDIPGENQVGYALPDQPLLAEKKVRYHGETIALVAGWDIDHVLQAAEEVKVKYKPLPALLDPLDAMERNDVLVHDEFGSNIAFRTKVRRGDVEKGFSEADVVVENEYRTHHQEHAYLETEAALAIPEDGGVTVIGCPQYPHLAQQIIARVLGLPASKIRVITPYIGGAFGGKDDEGPLVSAKAALVAYVTGKPAFLMYTREESIRIHPKREATIIKYKSGASRDGKLTAIKVTIIHDTGAYANRGPFILWRATVHASGPYYVPNAWVDGYCVYTNKVPQGSFRGFGNPSVQFAAESQMDELARKLGMDPVEFRLKNLLRPGMETITSQKLDHAVGVADMVDKLAKTINWWRLRKEVEEWNKRSKRFKRGVGIGVAWHGISTSRGVPDWSNAYIKIDKDGSVTVYTGIVEIGQGSPSSSHRQIVAEVLGVPLELVRIIHGTSDAPDTGATHASRGTSIGAIGVLVAAAKLRERLNKLAADLLNAPPDKIVMREGRIYAKGREEKTITWRELVKQAYARGIDLSATGYFFLPKGRFDNERGQGYAYPAYSFVAVVVEVEVDTHTGRTRVLKAWPGLAAGKIINPVQVEGQIEGAITQGIGYVLMEELRFGNKGEIINTDLTDYVIPTAMDAPLEVEKPVYVEDLFKYGPFGAKGVGEMAFIPLPAAIANAVSHALNTRVKELPLTPEKLLKLIKETER
ncbi:xanthine dehydrogenase family protein [Desulfurococcaceae archaeon MEX13E-LK6-19]|nr:xanthine dehydrogenase family protein [Desulfurococcaceae archaeon MEX13E-LK6-19]